MLGAGSMFLAAKTKNKLLTASPRKKMMQDGPVCLADGHLDKRRRIIIFCSKMKIGGMGQKVQRPHPPCLCLEPPSSLTYHRKVCTLELVNLLGR